MDRIATDCSALPLRLLHGESSQHCVSSELKAALYVNRWGVCCCCLFVCLGGGGGGTLIHLSCLRMFSVTPVRYCLPVVSNFIFFPNQFKRCRTESFQACCQGYYLNETDALLFTFNRQRCIHSLVIVELIISTAQVNVRLPNRRE